MLRITPRPAAFMRLCTASPAALDGLHVDRDDAVELVFRQAFERLRRVADAGVVDGMSSAPKRSYAASTMRFASSARATSTVSATAPVASATALRWPRRDRPRSPSRPRQRTCTMPSPKPEPPPVTMAAFWACWPPGTCRRRLWPAAGPRLSRAGSPPSSAPRAVQRLRSPSRGRGPGADAAEGQLDAAAGAVVVDEHLAAAQRRAMRSLPGEPSRVHTPPPGRRASRWRCAAHQPRRRRRSPPAPGRRSPPAPARAPRARPPPASAARRNRRPARCPPDLALRGDAQAASRARPSSADDLVLALRDQRAGSRSASAGPPSARAVRARPCAPPPRRNGCARPGCASRRAGLPGVLDAGVDERAAPRQVGIGETICGLCRRFQRHGHVCFARCRLHQPPGGPRPSQ